MARNTFECKSNSLSGVFDEHYSIGSYQREYKWGISQIDELLNDFRAAFDDSGLEAKPNTYFLGPIVTQKSNDLVRIIDGQQRLTTLTLIFIYLHNEKTVNEARKRVLKNLIYTTKDGEEIYAIDVNDRNGVFDKLLLAESKSNLKEYLEKIDSRSCYNIAKAYDIIEQKFEGWLLPAERLGKFVDWLSKDVYLVEVIADDNDMASTIFETMNDRGMSLTYTELLKAYVVSQFNSEDEIKEIDELWKTHIDKLLKQQKNGDSQFFRAWLRAKYIQTNIEYDEIGSKFHHWVRNNRQTLWGDSSNFKGFIMNEMEAFVGYYTLLHQASKPAFHSSSNDLEPVYFNSKTSFDLQYTCSLAPLTSSDCPESVRKKIKLVSSALDIFVVRRMVNYKSHSAGYVKNQIHKLTKRIRKQKTIEKLQDCLLTWLEQQEKDSGTIRAISTYKPEKTPHARYLLARITNWMQTELGDPVTIQRYMSTKEFQVEHILPNTYRENLKKFSQFDNMFDYTEYRDRLSAQLLIKKSDNAALGSDSFEAKLPVYYRNNLLAQSLSDSAYSRYPEFAAFRKKHRLGDELGPFTEFGKDEIEDRGKLLSTLAEKIWDPVKVLQV